MAVSMILCLLSTPVLANDGASDQAVYDINGSKKASPTELSNTTPQTTVTLSLPSAEYENEVDIVFVMDKSTSTTNNDIDFAENVRTLVESLKELNEDLTINIAVIKFRGYATDTIAAVSNNVHSGLTEYKADTAAIVDQAIAFKDVPGSGTNLHGGLDMANDLLAADTDLPDANKYVVVLTDGKSYIWNNDNDEPTTNYTQWYRHYEIQSGGLPALNQSGGAYDKAAYPVDVLDSGTKSNIFWFDDYAELYASKNVELMNATKYDSYCSYAYDRSVPKGIAEAHDTTNGASLFTGVLSAYQKYYSFTPDEDWAGISYYEANPYEVVKNEDGTYSFDTDTINPDYYMYHPDCLQKGLYKAGHLWTEMNDRYNCGAIIYDGWGNASGLSVAKSFCTWLKGNSDYGADINNTSEVTALFDTIQADIIYLIGRGSVTDIIDDDFDLVIPDSEASPFTLTVAGSTLAPTPLGENTWGFGDISVDSNNDQVADSYPYTVTYDPENTEGETIKWNLNIPVENAKPVQLSYKLSIRSDATAGKYNTNKSAILEYTSSDGSMQGEYSFEVPEVSYIVDEGTDPSTPSKPDTPNSPSSEVPTGDNSKAVSWLIIMLLAVAGITATEIYERNNR